jgi:hypothetical protein
MHQHFILLLDFNKLLDLVLGRASRDYRIKEAAARVRQQLLKISKAT